jgi:manganese oxidase
MLLVQAMLATALLTQSSQNAPQLPDVLPNDNRRPAGAIADGVLTLNLRAAEGLWRPEGSNGPVLRIEAFGEANGSLTIPAPLVRVTEGVDIAATVRNDLANAMRVHGLCDRGAACEPIVVQPGETRTIRFRSGPAGTYHYWATTSGMPLQFRAVGDTQLSGAFVVDPRGAVPNDRVFVITDWTSLTRAELARVARADDPGETFFSLEPKFTFLINGLSWPHTERLTYRLGTDVRWRVVNLSTQAHTMHLHGFYFEVDSLGDGTRNTIFPSSDRQRVVTQLMQPGATMGIAWTPEREGNWLFHCHIKAHVSPELRLVEGAVPSGTHHASRDPSAGMAGMILGVTVVGSQAHDALATNAPRAPQARKITLLMKTEPKRYGDEPAYGFVLANEGAPSRDPLTVPGPTLVLTRGEPVEITLVNRLPEGTAIHWHGMELESYYDGVHGWSGTGTRVTPLIEPGGSFVVRFTPPRSGTFMYHTHLHDNRQLTSGLYGAMLVLDEGETFDEATDHVFVMGRGGPSANAPAVLNGQSAPRVIVKAGARHRIRLINITPSDIFTVTLMTSDGPVTWRPLTKDGAPIPRSRCQPRPAKEAIGAGETYDFVYDAPSGRHTLWLEVRSPAGRWHNQAHITVK